jgi:hypothetical protein
VGRGASAAAHRRWLSEIELPVSARKTGFDEHVDAIGEQDIQSHASNAAPVLGIRTPLICGLRGCSR